MKKSILQFSVIAAIAATMTLSTSCSSDDGPAAYVPEPVQLSVGMSDMSVKASTRAQSSGTATDWTASIDGKLAVNDLVFIWMADADGGYYRKAYKVTTAATDLDPKNTLTENATGATGKFYWASTTEYKQYEVYSFGHATIGDSTNTTTARTPASVPKGYLCTVPDDQTVAANGIEFLFGYGTLYYGTGTDTKALKVSHQLARIDVTLVTDKNNVEVTKDQDGNDVDSDNVTDGNQPYAATTSETFDLKIGWSDMMRKGLFTPPSYTAKSTGAVDEIKGETADIGAWTAPPSPIAEVKGIITPRVLVEQRYNTSNKNFETQYSAVVMPQSFSGKDLFTINYDGAEYKYVIPSDALSTDPNKQLVIEPGKHYKFKVTLQNTKITVTVAIQDWTTDDKGSVEAKLQ